jgi:hypothetical protein
MKRLFTFVLLLIYFTVSSGVVVSMHYCMNKLDSTRLWTSSDDECGRCGMHKGENHCCWDDVTLVKLQTDHFASKLFVNDWAPAILVHPVVAFFQIPFYNFPHDAAVIPDSGPPLPTQDTYLQNCVFRI